MTWALLIVLVAWFGVLGFMLGSILLVGCLALTAIGFWESAKMVWSFWNQVEHEFQKR